MLELSYRFQTLLDDSYNSYYLESLATLIMIVMYLQSIYVQFYLDLQINVLLNKF